jgi:putative tRNA adenosine deaminase-associated protein
MAQRGFAVAAYRDAGRWRVEPLPPAVLSDLGVLVQALRSQQPEGGPFVVALVDDEFFLVARQDGPRISLLLSDMTASVEYPLAEQALARLGEDPPDDDELDELWPVGDLDLFSDLGLGEDEMEQILDDMDAYPDEMLDTIVERIGIAGEYAEATDAARAPR